MKMCWCTIMVRDMERSVLFYKDVLGLSIQRRFTAPDGMMLAFLSDGDSSQVELIQADRSPAYEGAGISLGFETASLADSMETFRQKNIEIIKGPFEVGGGTKFFYVKDPDGLDIQIVEHGKH